MVKISDPEGETVTRGSPYKFVLLNSSEISHLGKTHISPNWWNQFCSNLRCWKEDRRGYLIRNFRYIGAVISEIPQKQYQTFCRRNWRKLGHQIFFNFDHSFGKMNMLLSLPSGATSFYPIRLERFKVLKIKVSLKNPKSARSGTRTDTSNR